MVLVDDDLNVVSLRLFNQNADGNPAAVHVPDSGAFPQSDNPLLTAVRAALVPKDWADFSEAVGAALALRQRDVIKRFDLRHTKSGDDTPARRRAR